MNGQGEVPRWPLVLASGSPRRRELLSQLGLEFDVVVSRVEEPAYPGGDPGSYARRLAADKAAAVAIRHPHAVVLGADTIVVVDGDVLGKPEDDQHARLMIGTLRGREHQVMTAIALRGAAVAERIVATSVWFRALSDAEVARYVATGEGRDKAGAYGIQGLGAGIVERLTGSYTNVVGLPVVETLAMLQAAGAVGAWP